MEVGKYIHFPSLLSRTFPCFCDASCMLIYHPIVLVIQPIATLSGGSPLQHLNYLTSTCNAAPAIWVEMDFTEMHST